MDPMIPDNNFVTWSLAAMLSLGSGAVGYLTRRMGKMEDNAKDESQRLENITREGDAVLDRKFETERAIAQNQREQVLRDMATKVDIATMERRLVTAIRDSMKKPQHDD